MTSLVAHGDGQAVVVKEARGAAAASLRAEAQRLASAEHPGVVRVILSTGDDTRWELRTAHAGRPLDVGPRLTADELAAVAAAVATTLADLHEVGIVHGRLRASHVLIASNGRPVICGFGEGSSGHPADDVAAVGRIIVEHLAAEQSPEPIPERRWSARSRWTGWARASLLTLADQACLDPPSRRPTARRLAAMLTEAFDVPRATRPEVGASSGAPDGEPGKSTVRRATVMAGAVCAVVVSLVVVGSLTGAPRGSAPPRTTASSDVSLDDRAAHAQPTGAPDAPTDPGSAPSQDRRCSGSGCAQPTSAHVDGTLVTTGSGRFEVGRPGDAIVVGDWDCDGLATPAVLRPSTGDVFVFPTWAHDGELAVPPIRTVTGATEIVSTQLGDGCSLLSVRTADRRLIAVTQAST